MGGIISDKEFQDFIQKKYKMDSSSLVTDELSSNDIEKEYSNA